MNINYKKLSEILEEVRDERERQEKKHGENTCANPALQNGLKLAVLMEEVGEVGKVFCEQGTTHVVTAKSRNELRKELIQTAAVCIAWVESL